MQQAVLRHFPDTQASYKFTLRDKGVVFTKEAFDKFQETVDRQFHRPPDALSLSYIYAQASASWG